MSEIREVVASPRFCEWLDATAALESGWPHSPSSAARWACRACGADTLGDVEDGARPSSAWADVCRRFAGWDMNGELDV